MSDKQNAGFLAALIAGGRGKGAASSSGAALALPPPPATKAERDQFDLRLAWLPMLASAGRPEGGAEEGHDGDLPTPQGSASPSLPSGEDTDGVQPTEEELKVPRIKQLSDEAAKWRNKFRDAEKALAELTNEKGRADTAEANSKGLVDQLRGARMENAFLRTATGKVADLEAAWKLADKAEVKVNEDGTVEGLDAVLAKVLEKHPYLTPKPTEPADKELADRFPALLPSGRPNNGKKGSTDAVDYEKLAKLFPALRGRR